MCSRCVGEARVEEEEEEEGEEEVRAAAALSPLPSGVSHTCADISITNLCFEEYWIESCCSC